MIDLREHPSGFIDITVSQLDFIVLYLYMNLRRSRDGLRLFVKVEICVWISDPRFIQLALGICYTVHINALSI